MAGFRPGLGRGGMIHSLDVTRPGFEGAAPGVGGGVGLIESRGRFIGTEGAGAIAGGEVAEGTDAVGEAVEAMID